MLATYKTQDTIETVYTYTEWEKEYNRRKARRRIEATYYIKQKLTGLLFIVIGVAIPFIFKGEDASFSLLALPFGLFLMFTKEKIMDFKR